MAKPKQEGPALFDLLGNSQEEVNAQLRPRGVEPPAKPAGPIAPSRPRPERAIVPSRIDRTAAGPQPQPTPPASKRRLMEFDDECVRFSFTSTSAAISVFLAVVGILVVYEAGRQSGKETYYQWGWRAGRASFQADAESEIDAARSQPPSPHLVEDLLAATGAPASGESDPSVDKAAAQWVEGHTYIVAQEFSPRNRDDAVAAQEYLRSQGIDTALITQDNGWFQLVTTQGYNRSDPVQRDLLAKLLTREHRAGADYFASGGKYKLEGYYKTLRNQNW